MKDKKETAYLRRYRAKEIETMIKSIYHDEPEIEQAKSKLKNLVEEIEGPRD
jgi:transposase